MLIPNIQQYKNAFASIKHYIKLPESKKIRIVINDNKVTQTKLWLSKGWEIFYNSKCLSFKSGFKK